MNARLKDYKLSLDVRQVPDAITCIFHSLLLHRTQAKFEYKTETNFGVGSIGIKEVDCDSIDLSYVRINSDELAMRLDEDVRAFNEEVERSIRGRSSRDPPCQAHIGMEFFHRRRKGILSFYTDENTPWEQWNFHLTINICSDKDFASLRETAAEAVSEICLSVCSAINKNQYLPKMPNQKELPDVFDVQYSDVQPYLFKINRNKDTYSNTGISSTVKRVLKDTLFM